MEVSLQQLEAFVKVVELRSFSKAGEALFLSQSTVSGHVAHLEQALHATLLLRREKKNVEPTPEGQQAYRVAMNILNQVQSLTGMFSQAAAGPPLINLAASTVPSAYILPQLMTGFSALHPECRFSVLDGDSAFALSCLQNGEAAFAFVGMRSRQTLFRYYPVYQDRMVLITPNTPELAQKQQAGASGKELLHQPMIVRESGSGTRREADHYLKSIGVAPTELRIAAYMNNIEGLKSMVAGGVGNTIISRLAAEDAIRAGRVLCFDLEPDGPYRSIYMACMKDLSPSPMEQAFLRYVLKRTEE